MSRFDNELIKQADNAYQMHGLSGASATPARQLPHLQNIQPYADAMVPGEVPVVNQVGNLSNPMKRQIDTTDLESADPGGGQPGEIVGMPDMSQVYALGGPDPENGPGTLAPSTGFGGNLAGLPEGSLGTPNLTRAASIDPIDESLYQVYKASRDIRTAIKEEVDFDFSNIITASNEASTVSKFANTDSDVNEVVGTVASIVLDIENDLVNTGDYKQASADLEQLEGLLDEINKFAAKKNCKDCKGKGCKSCKKDDKDDDKDDEDSDGKPPWLNKKKKGKGKGKKKEATNGNQETGVTVDVRDLDDQAGVWDRARAMTPDFTTNVLEGEELNAEDAGYVPFYNDGSETGIVPGQEPHKQEVFPYDGTNPALVPYQNALGAVKASREKIFDALHVVERLEKLGMAREDERAKNLAIFEQMSDAKLAGVKVSIDLFEESGASQPRSQKVASNTNRLPEMGRLTTASTVSRQQLSADDWLMTL